MNIWLVTIGSSDVQLHSDNQSREKGKKEAQRSNKIWRYWYEDEVEEECYGLEFEPKQAYSDFNEPYRIEPRVLGMVYQSNSPDIQDEIWSYLTFPLLDNFVKKLQHSPPEAIVVLLTDQGEIFSSDDERRKLKCPYWQDTWNLQGILERYFQDRFSNIKTESIEWIPLAPTSAKKGLDNWDYVLDLVDEKLGNLQINGEVVNKESVETAYISHQAGTPAISSAVQFASLAKFEKVEFLVSNEYDSTLTELVPDSKYLRKLQREKAKQLLARHDYSGVKELLASSLTTEIKNLLDAAILWNFAKFDNFATAMAKAAAKYSQDNEWWRTINEQVEVCSKQWWWTAYESAYLAVVRLKQENTVEAMFHSFRAVEGLLAKWIDECHSSSKKGKKIQLPHKIEAPWDNTKKIDKVNAYGQGLYFALEVFKGVDQNKDTEFDIWTFGNAVFKIRNSLFHNLEGLQDKEAVFKAWEISKSDKQEDPDKLEQRWKNRILNCLNFIAEPQPRPTSLEEASLMFKVHEKLDKAIAS